MPRYWKESTLSRGLFETDIRRDGSHGQYSWNACMEKT